MLLNVQLQIHRSTLKQVVRSVLHLLGYIFWLVWPENLKPYEALQRCWYFLQRWEFAEAFLFSCSPCVHTPQLSRNPTHGNLMGSDSVTVVANPVYRYDQSIGLGIYDSDTAWWPDWNEVAHSHAGSTSVIVFLQEYSLRVLAVHLAKRWHKYHLSDVAGNVWSNKLVTNDTTPHVYRKSMLAVAFDSSMWIITIQ